VNRKEFSASVASVIVTLALAAASPYSLGRQRAETDKPMRSKITIRIGDKSFAATLSDNASAAAVKKLLPLSVTMTELNGNEKFARLSVRLPTQESKPASIQAGDLMLYGSSTLVLFYESFTTTYSYTTIGHVDDPGGLKAALGVGDVDATFESTGNVKQ
jgi:hypothetical protein